MSNQENGYPGQGNRDQGSYPNYNAGPSSNQGQTFNSNQPGGSGYGRSGNYQSARQPGYPAAQPQPGKQPFNAPQRTGDYRQPAQRIVRDIGAPIALIVIAAILATALALLAMAGSPVAFLIGMIPSLLGLAIGLGCYMWLDRWEPEPPRLLLTAFLWGGGVATAGAILIGLLIQVIFVAARAEYTPFFGAVIQAPIVEEALKAAWLFIMLSGARRREMNTLTDHLVYAGFSAFGFAFVENLLYFARAQSMEDVIAMSVIRTGFNLFGHALYTSATALGIYYARKNSDKLQAGPVILGYLGAVLLHALWNGAASISFQALLVVYVVLLVPAFVGLIMLGLRSRKQEGEIVSRQLTRMVNEGIVSAQDASWLSQLQSRAEISKRAEKKTPEGGRVRAVSDAVSELSIIRERLGSMKEASPFLIEEERYLVAELANLSGRSAAGQNAGGLPGAQSQAYSNGAAGTQQSAFGGHSVSGSETQNWSNAGQGNQSGSQSQASGNGWGQQPSGANPSWGQSSAQTSNSGAQWGQGPQQTSSSGATWGQGSAQSFGANGHWGGQPGVGQSNGWPGSQFSGNDQANTGSTWGGSAEQTKGSNPWEPRSGQDDNRNPGQ